MCTVQLLEKQWNNTMGCSTKAVQIELGLQKLNENQTNYFKICDWKALENLYSTSFSEVKLHKALEILQIDSPYFDTKGFRANDRECTTYTLLLPNLLRANFSMI